MLSSQLIKSVIEAQMQDIQKKDSGVERALLKHVPYARGFASIITGLRRCGKSTLHLQIKRKSYPAEGLFLNFEDTRLSAFDAGDFERLYAVVKQFGSRVLFFDEIQNAQGWEQFVNHLLREDYQIFITGSNATLLSRELGTHLTGRHFTSELFPFSFSEFCAFRGLLPGADAFQLYAQQGGMPDYLRTGLNQYLNDLLNDILIRDIAVRHGLRDVNALRALTVYLLTNVGSRVSANALTDLFGIRSSTTVLEYFSYLKDAYLLEFVPLFDFSLKRQIRNPQKVYATDTGIHHHNKISFSPNDGHVLENMVYLHLRRAGKGIYYFQQKGECDFLLAPSGRPEAVFQVCYELSSLNLDRELNGLFEAMTYFGIEKGKLITFNQTDVFRKGKYTVEVVAAWQWMSEGLTTL